MISILFAALGISSRRLDVTAGRRAYPYFCPGGWDTQRGDALQRLLIRDTIAVRRDIRESISVSIATYAGTCVGEVPKAGSGGGLNWIRDERRRAVLGRVELFDCQTFVLVSVVCRHQCKEGARRPICTRAMESAIHKCSGDTLPPAGGAGLCYSEWIMQRGRLVRQ